jgi:hypothetical protein
MRWSFMIPMLGTLVCSAAAADEGNKDILRVKVDGAPLISYQASPILEPKGGDKFNGSNFIHPLKTPSGFVVTDIQPSDHLHHFGLWWPWKYIVTEGRKVLFWEPQEADGIIQAQDSKITPGGFSAQSIYIDRKAPGGPQTLINETLNVKTSQIVERPARGYYLDLEIIHEVAVNKPITVLKYRYSGFSLRGTPKWNKSNSTVMTSAGKNYDGSNFTRAKWVRVEGRAEDGDTAGVLLMSYSENYDHPELLRTWNRKTHNGAIFINFNSVQEKSWVFEPGEKYTRRFRVFVYDGTLSTQDAEIMWKQYIRTKGTTLPSEGVPSDGQ